MSEELASPIPSGTEPKPAPGAKRMAFRSAMRQPVATDAQATQEKPPTTESTISTPLDFETPTTPINPTDSFEAVPEAPQAGEPLPAMNQDTDAAVLDRPQAQPERQTRTAATTQVARADAPLLAAPIPESASDIESDPGMLSARAALVSRGPQDEPDIEPEILPASTTRLGDEIGDTGDLSNPITASVEAIGTVGADTVRPEPEERRVEPVPRPARQRKPVPAFEAVQDVLGALWAPIDTWVNSAAGYDEKILKSFGTPTDEKRRRNIGRAIVVATLVGSLGWLVKISLSMPAPWGVVVGLVIAGLYGVLSYSLESFFASNVNPFAAWWSKTFSLIGRALLSAVIAFSGALPWVVMSLQGSIGLEMAKLGLQEQLVMREGIDKVTGMSSLAGRSTAMQAELAQWNEALSTLPAPIQAAIASADQCEAQFAVMREAAPKRIADLNGRLAVLARLERSAQASPQGASQRLAAVATERRQVNGLIAGVNKGVSDKRAECSGLLQAANTARDDHVKVATEQRSSAQSRLAQQREIEQSAMNQVRTETAKADQLTKTALSENSAGEFTALVSLLKTQLHAQFLAGLIFLGLFLVDVLPLTLRLFARPGPYDAEKRTDDEIRMMRAEGRSIQAELIHSARKEITASKDLRELVKREVQPHIRAIALNNVGSFVAKHVNAPAAAPEPEPTAPMVARRGARS